MKYLILPLFLTFAVLGHETNEENDKTRLSYAEIIHWYDNYFLSYGIQRIINRKDKDVERKRTVFFFNKIKLD